MATRKALGRGLSALIPPAPKRGSSRPGGAQKARPVADAGAPLFVAIARIAPNPSQPRKIFDEAELTSLAASIREQGILQPLVVRARGDGYELIIGERRWRAAQLPRHIPPMKLARTIASEIAEAPIT